MLTWWSWRAIAYTCAHHRWRSVGSTLCRNLAGYHEQRAARKLQFALSTSGAVEQDRHTMKGLTCSALLAMAIMFAGSPALTTQVTMAEGMDSLGSRLISYLSRVVVCAAGSGSTTHDPLYSYSGKQSLITMIKAVGCNTRGRPCV